MDFWIDVGWGPDEKVERAVGSQGGGSYGESLGSSCEAGGLQLENSLSVEDLCDLHGILDR